MSNLARLVPLRDQTAEANLARLIEDARAIAAADARIAFDQNVWNVSHRLARKSARSDHNFGFGAWLEPRASKNVSPRPMPEPFLSFAKAWILLEMDAKENKSTFGRDFQALRLICHALEKTGATSPTLLTSFVLNDAAAEARATLAPGTSYAVGMIIEAVARLIDQRQLAKAPLQWRSPIPAELQIRNRIGKEFDERRNEKLPDKRVLVALGKAYQSAEHPEDVIFSSMPAIMLAFPDRVSEVCSMLADCESATAGDGSPGYGVRWWPAKDGAPQIKAVPEVMRDVVQDAIRRVRCATEHARMVARSYEDQVQGDCTTPTRMFVPPHLQHLRAKTLLTRKDISLLLYDSEAKADVKSLEEWLPRRGIKPAGQDGRLLLYRFSDVEKAVLSYLPLHFPFSDGTKRWKCSELLFTRVLYSNTTRRPFTCIYVPMDALDLNRRLDGRTKNSIFERLQLNEFDEHGKPQPFHVRSHQFRHYLNHLAHSSGDLSQVDINLWSGRKVGGEHYNHLSSREITGMATDLLAGRSLGSLPAPQRTKALTLYSRAEFSRLGIDCGHTTDFGYCVHDFTATPCQKHEECLDCNEHFCIKGDVQAEMNIQRERDELAHLIQKAQTAQAEGKAGANRWLDRQRSNHERADQLLRIMQSPTVPDGAPIRLTGAGSYSRIQHAQSAEARTHQPASIEQLAPPLKQSRGSARPFSMLPLTKSSQDTDE